MKIRKTKDAKLLRLITKAIKDALGQIGAVTPALQTIAAALSIGNDFARG